ncbi:MAG: hypothetical protein KKH52_04915 [Nanoarchaeota archaeon]|nr:hypothetical protein [Nanoarchaeota archaeon]
MKIEIKKEVFRKFNQKLRVAFILVEGIDNKTKLKESKHLLQEAEHLTHLTFHKRTIKNHDLISPWEVAKAGFGKKARHYHTSVERLLKKILKRKSVAGKDVVTNLVRYLAVKHIIPLGVDDYDRIKGGLTFSLAKGRERIGKLSRVKRGDLIYRDEKNILGTKLDFWKSKKTVLNNNSNSALIHIEALPPITNKELNELVKEVKDLISSFCGGKVKSFVLSERKNAIKV